MVASIASWELRYDWPLFDNDDDEDEDEEDALALPATVMVDFQDVVSPQVAPVDEAGETASRRIFGAELMARSMAVLVEEEEPSVMVRIGRRGYPEARSSRLKLSRSVLFGKKFAGYKFHERTLPLFKAS